MSSNSFRLAVDLTSLFDDYRSWCFIYLESGRFSAINDLEIYLQDLFGIKTTIRLFVGKYLLPSPESIKLLCTGETITVVGANDLHNVTENNDAQVKKRKHSQTRENLSSQQINLMRDASPVIVSSLVEALVGEDCSAVPQASEEHDAVSENEDSNTKLTELKPFMLEDDTVTKVAEATCDAKDVNESNHVLIDRRKKYVVTEDSNFSALGENQLNILKESGAGNGLGDKKIDSSVIQKKRKRTRHRKKKIMLSSSVGEAVSLIRASIGTFPLSDSEKCFSGVSDKYMDSSKHIRFSDDDYDTSVTVESDRDVDFKVNASKFSPFNRNMQSPCHKSSSNWDVKFMPDTAARTRNFVNLLSLRHKAAPVVFERKQTKKKVSETLPVQAVEMLASHSVADEKSNDSLFETANKDVHLELNKDPNDYPVLNSAPKRHDVILFKTLVLTENCIPQLSSYILATVVDFCSLSCDVKLQITSNGQELHQQPLKFAAETQTDLPEDDVTTINWNEIHETRLVSRAT